MDAEMMSFLILLSILWFLLYWILGGVFFAVVTVMKLGRLRKVRFSCLFSLLSLVLGIGTAYVGMRQSELAVRDCLGQASGNAEMVTAVFGCGFAGIFGTFLLGAVLLTIGGFLIMAISKSKTKPWIILDPEDQPEEGISQYKGGSDTSSNSRFF
ncbi:hypothetical protein COV05_01850 [Candidatus Uhrbacteria bacterium CG10_big_fil_rev_8_21_14_0_10_48_16]|uniref:Uncharacterized protein n=1 Tax=Candidatus Uhrbacteria bacterium CG10_big_fil_rev_8_21_14_0_10_48_16 TaxID=1975038 RepID=A0A2M8LHJ6_9BACT|nr:MAG: hypothetical protein COV05_01850 [Candidatus Uhrbacteria bacterium CG10_big_fil_rev_8_21_14_0_10_48_16]